MNKKGANSAFILMLVMLGLIGFLAMGGMKYFQQTTPITSTEPKDEITTGLANLGKASTIKSNAYDVEPTVRTSKTDVNTSVYQRESSSAAYEQLKTYGVYSIGDSTGVSSTVGMYLSFVPIDNSYYGDPIFDKLIAREADTWSINVHTAAAESSMTVVCYDNTGTTEMSAGTNSSQEDYDITLGANEEDVIFCKLTNKDTDSLFKLKAICVGEMNDIQSVKVSQADWTEVVMPDYIDKAYQADVGSDTSLTYSRCYEYKAGTTKTIDLSEYDSEKVKFVVKAGSTDPTTSQTPNLGDVAQIIFIDANWFEDVDGTPAFGWHDHADTATDVGINETETSPLGKLTGMVFEAI